MNSTPSHPGVVKKLICDFNKSTSIFHENMRSVVNVKHELIRSTSTTEYDIITITETWLRKDHHNNEFISDKYTVFREDRSEANIKANRGRGVLIAVREEIECVEHKTPEMDGLEAVCVQFPLKRGKLLVYCLYIQPDADLETYELHTKAITSLRKSNNDIVLIAGDFNLPLIMWLPHEDNSIFVPLIGESECRAALIAKYVTSELMEAGFFQMCNIVSEKRNHVLDLVYTNLPECTSVEKATNKCWKMDLATKHIIR